MVNSRRPPISKLGTKRRTTRSSEVDLPKGECQRCSAGIRSFPKFQSVAIELIAKGFAVPNIVSENANPPNARDGSAASLAMKSGTRESFIAWEPAVVRESEASGWPVSGRPGASQSPPSVGVPVSNPRASCSRPDTGVRARSVTHSALWNHLLAVRGRETGGRASQNVALDARLMLVDFAGIHRAARDPVLAGYPLPLQIHLKDRYLETAGARCRILLGDERWVAVEAGRGTDSYFQADIELSAIDETLRRSYIDIAFDDYELWARAQRHADACWRFAVGNPADRALQLAGDYARRHGLSAPTPQVHRVSAEACIKRLQTFRWWYRAMRRAYGRLAEDALRRMGFVHQRGSIYVSAEALRSRINRRLATMQLLDRATATNDLGQSFSLGELSACNTSSPSVRRAELMVRVRGIETYATAHGHVGQFFVVTTPSRFHCMLESGVRNSRHHGATIRDGQWWLNHQWQLLRASLGRKAVAFYGLRTAEPHHDATPHWNVLIFSPPADAETIAREFERYFLLNDSPDEPGARNCRVRRVKIDPAKGDATSYIAKYISKAIDGFGVGVDHEDNEHRRDAKETCVRVEAWASIHGIRQFQFFGGPPVSVWRELRRLQRVSLGVIEDARQAAEEPSWCSYIDVQGGTHRRGVAWPVRVHKAYSADPGLYGDPLGTKTVGIESDNLVEVTRSRQWEIKWPVADRWTGFFSSSESCQ
jgi:Bacteriophage replication gene A protein (GPA)